LTVNLNLVSCWYIVPEEEYDKISSNFSLSDGSFIQEVPPLEEEQRRRTVKKNESKLVEDNIRMRTVAMPCMKINTGVVLD
jgi:hypothetical protein